jgi:hypothetical protein
MELKTYECENCGAEVFFDPNLQVMKCDFCGSTFVPEDVGTTDVSIDEETYIIPFQVEEGEVSKIFQEWIKKGWFKPGDLASTYQRDSFRGIYIPNWYFHFNASVHWSGEKDIRKSRSVTSADGSKRTEHYTETEHRSGSFDDMIELFIPSSRGLSVDEINELAPFPIESSIPFGPEKLTGKQAEKPNLDKDLAWSKAKEKANDIIRDKVQSEVTRINHLDVNLGEPTHRLVYVPTWLFGYKYKGKYYKVMVNGQTGEIQGKKPVSWLKVVIAGGIVILGIILIVLLFNLFGG